MSNFLGRARARRQIATTVAHLRKGPRRGIRGPEWEAMLLNGLFRGALMLTAGALFSWGLATAFETRASMHSTATAATALTVEAVVKTDGFTGFNLASTKQGRVRSLF
jgi:hypothetical protein